MTSIKCELTIGTFNGAEHPPPIAITIKVGLKRIRVNVTPEDFALALTGRLVEASIEKKDF